MPSRNALRSPITVKKSNNLDTTQNQRNGNAAQQLTYETDRMKTSNQKIRPKPPCMAEQQPISIFSENKATAHEAAEREYMPRKHEEEAPTSTLCTTESEQKVSNRFDSLSAVNVVGTGSWLGVRKRSLSFNDVGVGLWTTTGMHQSSANIAGIGDWKFMQLSNNTLGKQPLVVEGEADAPQSHAASQQHTASHNYSSTNANHVVQQTTRKRRHEDDSDHLLLSPAHSSSRSFRDGSLANNSGEKANAESKKLKRQVVNPEDLFESLSHFSSTSGHNGMWKTCSSI